MKRLTELEELSWLSFYIEWAITPFPAPLLSGRCFSIDDMIKVARYIVFTYFIYLFTYLSKRYKIGIWRTKLFYINHKDP